MGRESTRATAKATDRLRELRRFHLGEPGGPGGGLRGLEAGHGLLPRHLEPFRDRSGEPSAIRTEAPLFLGPPDGPAGDLCVPLAELLERSAPSGNRHLADNLRRLESHLRRLAGGPDRGDEESEPGDAHELLRRAGDAVLDELALGDDDARALSEGLETLRSRVPEGGRFVDFGRRLALDLLLQAALARTAAARAKTMTEARRLRSELEGILAADDRRRSGGAPEALAGSLGALGSRRVRADGLSGIVDPRRGGEPLDDALRRRLDDALEALSGLTADAGPPVLCVAADAAGGLSGLLGVNELTGWRVVASDDPCREAAARFDEGAERVARRVRATQLVRLSSEGRYEPARHDDWLDRLDHRALDADELATAPAVVALVSADHAAREGMLSLSSLLLSGRPVQVVVTIEPGGSPGAAGEVDETGEDDDPLSGFRFEPGYHGLGHREAFVSQGTPARPVHLMETFRRAVATTRTALHVVAAVPRSGEPPGGYLRAAAALEGRAHALFRYDPEAGATWARRLDFSGNPDPELDWPTSDDAGPFTFAHFALTEPGYAGCFTPVPEGVPDEAVTPLARWLDLTGEERVGVVPTLDAADGAGRPIRLALTRRLALATGDRLSYWRTLQELAGVRSEYADRAAAEARREAEESARAETESLAARHAAELERVRATAVRQAAERITSALLDVDPALFESARSPFEPFRGRDPEEVSRDLLGMLGDLGGANGLDTGGPELSDDADRLAARLMQLIDDDPSIADPSPDDR